MGGSPKGGLRGVPGLSHVHSQGHRSPRGVGPHSGAERDRDCGEGCPPGHMAKGLHNPRSLGQTARVPVPTRPGIQVGDRVALTIPGLHGDGAVPGFPSPSRAGRARRRGSPYLRPENGAPPMPHAAPPPGSRRSPRQSSAQARGPPMLRPAPSAPGPRRPARQQRPARSRDARSPVPSGGGVGGAWAREAGVGGA